MSHLAASQLPVRVIQTSTPVEWSKPDGYEGFVDTVHDALMDESEEDESEDDD